MMIGLGRLESLYARDPGAVNFAVFLRDCSALSDEELAELIEADGRQRLDRNLPVRLERYLEAIPDLPRRRDAIDAAIDVTLRSLAGQHQGEQSAAEVLIEQYPELANTIREAAVLNDAIWSTNGLRSEITPQRDRALPEDFGPPMDDGRRRYELQEMLGRGAFGNVYMAVDRHLSDADHPARVAIKILHAADRPTRSRRRLAEEATKARRVNHANVVRVLDRGVTEDDEDFIVYELVEGGDLASWLAAQGRTIPPRRAVSMVAAIARGLQAAHTAGLVHCDLKPGNIMLTGDGVPKVADFGIAIRAGESLRDMQQSPSWEQPIGNLAYIAPEQYRMEDGALHVPADVYALGGILYTMLTGELPNGSSEQEIRLAHHPVDGRHEAPRLRSRGKKIDRDLEAICRRALAPKPEDRYSAAGAMADDLDAWLRHQPLHWTRPSLGRVIGLWARRSPAIAAISVLLVLTILASIATAGYLIRERDLERQRAEIESIRAEEEALRKARGEQVLRMFLEAMEQRQAHGRTSTDLLPPLWTIEMMLGPDVLDLQRSQGEVRRLAYDAVRAYIREAEMEGRGDELDPLLWRSNLAFWLISQNELDEAGTIIGPLVQAWSDLLPDDDRWLRYMEGIEGCYDIRRVLHDYDHAPPPSKHARLLQARSTVYAAIEQIAARDVGTAFHLLCLQTLKDLYAPDVLHQPRQRERVDELLRWYHSKDSGRTGNAPPFRLSASDVSIE